MRRAIIFWWLTRRLCLKTNVPNGHEVTWCAKPVNHPGSCSGDWDFENRLHHMTGNSREMRQRAMEEPPVKSCKHCGKSQQQGELCSCRMGEKRGQKR